MHHNVLPRCCVDIDGVLCIDPTEEENDDDANYRRFLLEAKPLWTPSYEVGWLVTSRLEKWRKPTEKWLAQQGVRYRELVMLDLPSREARIQSGCHARFKAEVYRNTPAVLFIESSAPPGPRDCQA